MAHFAYINSSNIVEQCIVVKDSYLLDENEEESEAVGIAWCERILESESGKYWKRYSYNTYKGVHLLGGTPFRKNAAHPGHIYDASVDAFYLPRPTDSGGDPCASWTINGATGVWDPPIVYPSDDLSNVGGTISYYWDESAYQADNTQGWVAP